MKCNAAPPDAFKEAAPLVQVGDNQVEYRGRRLIYFAGCDYFRLASHPAIVSAVREAVQPHKFNVAASRVTTGNHPLYRQAEQKLARFFGAHEALLLPTGYVTNLVVAQALAGAVTHVLVDERSHVCLHDAAKLLGGPVRSFRHCDSAALGKQIAALPKGAHPLVMTDGMFARNGAVAPLAEHLAVLPRQGWLLVDDAHGVGVLGRRGRGTPEHCGVCDARLIQTATLSKAFGTYGGLVLCPSGWRARLMQRSHLFAGSTPMPLPLVEGAMASLAELEQSGKRRRKRLQSNAAVVRSALTAAGWPAADHPGPIFPLFPRDARQAVALRRALLRHGVFPSFIHYPGGPAAGSYRFVISSEHTASQLDCLAAALAAAKVVG